MLKRIVIISLLLFASGLAQAANVEGLIVKQSPYSAEQTMDRFERILNKKGIMIVAKLSHDANGARVGIDLRPTRLIIFGNPRLGSHFFTNEQTAGIDLPMKVLVWEDAEGRVWLGYNDPKYIADRHHIGDRAQVLGKMTRALDKLTTAAVSK